MTRRAWGEAGRFLVLDRARWGRWKRQSIRPRHAAACSDRGVDRFSHRREADHPRQQGGGEQYADTPEPGGVRPAMYAPVVQYADNRKDQRYEARSLKGVRGRSGIGSSLPNPGPMSITNAPI